MRLILASMAMVLQNSRNQSDDAAIRDVDHPCAAWRSRYPSSIERCTFAAAPISNATRLWRQRGNCMADNGLVLVTGAAGQLGAVGRTVTGLLLDRGVPVRAMARRE